MKTFIKIAKMVNKLPKAWKANKKIILKCGINEYLNKKEKQIIN